MLFYITYRNFKKVGDFFAKAAVIDNITIRYIYKYKMADQRMATYIGKKIKKWTLKMTAKKYFHSVSLRLNRRFVKGCFGVKKPKS